MNLFSPKSLLKAAIFSLLPVEELWGFWSQPRAHSRWSSRLPRLPRTEESLLRIALRVVAGAVFITLGQMKFFDSILLGTDAVTLPTGPDGFAQYLAAIGVPFPLFNAYMVCLVEMLCGLGLVLSTFLPASAFLTRLCALPLVGDMIVALSTVGIPNLLGHPVMLGGVAVTTQAWRLPLEGLLLVISALFLVRPRTPPPGVPATS